MYQNVIKIVLCIALSFSFAIGAQAQNTGKVPYVAGSREQRQVQSLIDHSITFAENMLIKQGAYAPYAAVLTVTDSIIRVNLPPDYQKQDLLHIIADIKSTLKTGADKGMYKAVAMFYDVTVTDPATNLQTDATAVFTEQMNTVGSYTYYYPYKKNDQKGLTRGKTFGALSDNEIFLKVVGN